MPWAPAVLYHLEFMEVPYFSETMDVISRNMTIKLELAESHRGVKEQGKKVKVKNNNKKGILKSRKYSLGLPWSELFHFLGINYIAWKERRTSINWRELYKYYMIMEIILFFLNTAMGPYKFESRWAFYWKFTLHTKRYCIVINFLLLLVISCRKVCRWQFWQS